MLNRLLDFLLVATLTVVYRTYSLTWRVRHLRHSGPVQGGRPRVYAHWHGDELLLIGSYVYNNMAVMLSRSRDGERLKRMLYWLGFRVVRGSSSRGGAGGLKGL